MAEKLGISSAPTLILPDGKVLPGYKDAKTLLGLIGN
jgi:protein-disulfide isomerase